MRRNISIPQVHIMWKSIEFNSQLQLEVLLILITILERRRAIFYVRLLEQAQSICQFKLSEIKKKVTQDFVVMRLSMRFFKTETEMRFPLEIWWNEFFIQQK